MIKVVNKIIKESICCYKGILNGICMSIIIGDVKGINEKICDMVLWGFLIIVKNLIYIVRIRGNNIGSINCWVLVLLFIVVLIVVYNDVYNK